MTLKEMKVTIVTAMAVEIGDSVTFGIASLTNDTPMDTYEWTFTNGLAGSGVLTWPPDGDVSITRTISTSGGTNATLTVVDKLGCEGEGHITVCVDPPQAVPLLTLPGLLALIGMMCIVGAGRRSQIVINYAAIATMCYNSDCYTGITIPLYGVR